MSVRNERVPAEAASVTRTPFPKSHKVYVPGTLHADVRVPMREIALSPMSYVEDASFESLKRPTGFENGVITSEEESAC